MYIDKMIDGDVLLDFQQWLVSHEDDIEAGVNDYGELRDIFKAVVGREAGEIIDVSMGVW